MKNFGPAWMLAFAMVASACAHTDPERLSDATTKTRAERPSETLSDDELARAFTNGVHGDPDEAVSKPSEYVGSATPLQDVDLESLLEATDTALRMESYSIDTSRTSYDKREMFTHWDTYLASNRFEGKRHRAIVKFTKAPEGGWAVSVVVQMQRNVDIKNPSNAAEANWEDMAPSETRASVILYRIESGFREPDGDAAKMQH